MTSFDCDLATVDGHGSVFVVLVAVKLVGSDRLLGELEGMLTTACVLSQISPPYASTGSTLKSGG